VEETVHPSQQSKGKWILLQIIVSCWLLKVLKDDKRAIFTAASHAQKAADYLHGLQPNADTAPAEDMQEAA
jgi:antirestriction protein ArdC